MTDETIVGKGSIDFAGKGIQIGEISEAESRDGPSKYIVLKGKFFGVTNDSMISAVKFRRKILPDKRKHSAGNIGDDDITFEIGLREYFPRHLSPAGAEIDYQSIFGEAGNCFFAPAVILTEGKDGIEEIVFSGDIIEHAGNVSFFGGGIRWHGGFVGFLVQVTRNPTYNSRFTIKSIKSNNIFRYSGLIAPSIDSINVCRAFLASV